MFNLCVDNTQVVFLFPVKSSYLSLPLNPHIPCWPTQPSVQFLPLSPTTPVHTSQHCPQTFIHKLHRHIRQFTKAIISFVMTVCLSVCPFFFSERKNWAYTGWIFMKFSTWGFFECFYLNWNMKCYTRTVCMCVCVCVYIKSVHFLRQAEVPQAFPGRLRPRIITNFDTKIVVSRQPTPHSPLPQQKSLVLIFRDWVDLRAHGSVGRQREKIPQWHQRGSFPGPSD
jgi:hypothetical protein